MYIGKNQKILVAVLAFVLFLTIGYALFSERINISGTAQAKGNFKLSSSCVMGFSDDFADYMGVGQNEMQHGYAEESCVADGTSVTMKTNLLYPGASRYFTVTITNTGSLDAVLPTDDEFEIQQNLTVYHPDGSVSLYNSPLTGDARMFAHFIGFGDGSLMVSKTANGELAMDPNEVSMMVMDDYNKSYLRLKPGESLIVAILVEWNSDATDKTRYSEVTGTLSLPFQQATLDMQDTTEGAFCVNGC